LHEEHPPAETLKHSLDNNALAEIILKRTLN
jgi:hypothetical protein